MARGRPAGRPAAKATPAELPHGRGGDARASSTASLPIPFRPLPPLTRSLPLQAGSPAERGADGVGELKLRPASRVEQVEIWPRGGPRSSGMRAGARGRGDGAHGRPVRHRRQRRAQAPTQPPPVWHGGDSVRRSTSGGGRRLRRGSRGAGCG
jgi:hypothetical protein